jgi:7,8-dihydroneopterin aldolase/epimerase/oxygenase
MDRIEIRGLRAHGHHGVFDDERRHGQLFVVDLVLECDLSRPAASDALEDTVDYGALAERVGAAVAGTRFDLIEALAAHLADLVLEAPEVGAVTVRVAKPDAPVAVDVDEVAVALRRTRTGAAGSEA